MAALPEDSIDVADVPERRDWSGAQRGAFYRPVKRQITLRLDADLIAWFRREGGEGYQTRINRALRDHMRRAEREAPALPPHQIRP